MGRSFLTQVCDGRRGGEFTSAIRFNSAMAMVPSLEIVNPPFFDPAAAFRDVGRGSARVPQESQAD